MPSRKSVSAEACNCWISLSARDSALLSCRIVPLSQADVEPVAPTVRDAERALAGDLAGDFAGDFAGDLTDDLADDLAAVLTDALAGLRPGPFLRRFVIAPSCPPALVFSPV